MAVKSPAQFSDNSSVLEDDDKAGDESSLNGRYSQGTSSKAVGLGLKKLESQQTYDGVIGGRKKGGSLLSPSNNRTVAKLHAKKASKIIDMTPGHGGTSSAASNSRYPAALSNSKMMRQRA